MFRTEGTTGSVTRNVAPRPGAEDRVDAAVVRVDDLAHDGQAQAGALGLGREKRTEDALEIVGARCRGRCRGPRSATCGGSGLVRSPTGSSSARQRASSGSRRALRRRALRRRWPADSRTAAAAGGRRPAAPAPRARSACWIGTAPRRILPSASVIDSFSTSSSDDALDLQLRSAARTRAPPPRWRSVAE